MAFETLEIETHGAVRVVALNRPDALNALSYLLTSELTQAIKDYEADDALGCMILTGRGKAFAAGADIKEMATKDFAEAYGGDFITATWEELTRTRKPVIAAVNGFALGGGCEFAMMCDMVFASEKAKFGQPEIKLGVIPGSGGTQRLTKLVGKSVAMDLILTGRMITAQEAKEMGLVARVVPHDELMTVAMEAAQTIAGFGRLAVMAAKESVNRALEIGLTEGVRFERRIFHGLFGTHDQREGMAAFIEKREPQFKGK